MATKKKPAADLAAQYKVMIAGISRPGLAPAFQGEIVDGSTLGGAERVAKLLELKRIEPMTEDEADADGAH